MGLEHTSRAAVLLAESVTMCIDAGLYCSADSYNHFDPIENKVCKCIFWCVYIWDKQLGDHFGRSSLLFLRDCDVGELTPVNDKYIICEAIVMSPSGKECRYRDYGVKLRIEI